MDKTPFVFFSEGADNLDLFPLYEALERALLTRYPDCVVAVQKSQISFSCPKPFLYLWLLGFGRKIKGRTGRYFVLTLCMPRPLQSPRIGAMTEPYPGRFTCHMPISRPADLDAEFWSWVEESYRFRCMKLN